ncbi:hypothetical protein Fmac_015720 [Flemingia macrophylla]|uniref:Uncharacterized protein n=1 Tax=Flemingia macrophylla TaxID=520843 RepID=A0ABD1MFG6_9FABA
MEAKRLNIGLKGMEKREWKRKDLKGKKVESEVVCFKGKIVESVEKVCESL